jgi:hypothetical protein
MLLQLLILKINYNHMELCLFRWQWTSIISIAVHTIKQLHGSSVLTWSKLRVKCKNKNMQNYNFVSGFVCVWTLVSDIKGGETRYSGEYFSQGQIKWQEDGNLFIRRSFIISTIFQVHIIRTFKSRRLRLEGHVARMGRRQRHICYW